MKTSIKKLNFNVIPEKSRCITKDGVLDFLEREKREQKIQKEQIQSKIRDEQICRLLYKKIKELSKM